jgi:signal transduction histidine kinase
LHFFSRYSHIWKFNPEKEKAYIEFNRSANQISLSIISLLIMIGMGSFLVIDFFRNVNYSLVLIVRGTLLVLSSFLFFYSRRRKLTPRQIDFYTTMALGALAAFAFATAFFGSMPSFFLTNTTITILVFVTTISGLRFRHGFIFNLTYIALFWAFSWFIKRDPFYFSQYANTFLMFLYSTIAGLMIENQRRRSFIQFQDLVRQKVRTEDLNQQKNKIISLLSHDVASPIHSLAGLLHLQESGQVKDEELKPFVKEVRKRLDSVSTLVFGLVRWSRSQLEGFVPERKSIDLQEMIGEVVELFRPGAADKDVQIQLETTGKLKIFSDEEMIRIALRNLVSNAVKFSEQHSIVTVKAVRATELIKIKVINKGGALKADVLKKLFSYQVVSSEGTAGEKGTGLGLAMASHFVKSNGGKIYFEGYDSTTQQVTFVIELPAEKEN